MGGLKGYYQNSLDAKGRVNFPAKLREKLGSAFTITYGMDECLYVYSEEEWETFEERLRSLPAEDAEPLVKFFVAGAVDTEPDKQGRILIPAHLREYAGLGKDLVFVGQISRVEIWDSSRYENIEKLSADKIKQKVYKLGLSL